MKRLSLGLIAACCGVLAAVTAFAQSPTNKTIRFVIPYPPGNYSDVIARVIGTEMANDLGQTIYIDNKPGASGTIATKDVARAQPDGSTMLWGTASTVVTSTLFLKDVGFDPQADLDPIGMVGEMPFALAVWSGLPVKTVQELVAYAGANPGKLTYGSDGLGTTTHLATELLKKVAGIDMTHVPYRGAAAYETDLTTGRIQVSIAAVNYAARWAPAGNVRILAVTSAERLKDLPNVPTIAESGYPNYVATSWWALFAPRNSPPATIARLNTALGKALATEAFKKVSTNGFQVISAPPALVSETIDRELKVWRDLQRTTKIEVE